MSSVLIRQYTNIAGLVLLVYDQIITWDKEVNHIWRSSDWVLKVMFFLARYGALATQIINLVATHPYILEQEVMGCYTWFSFQTGAIGILLLNLQLVLMLRVYALYERSKKVAGFLVGWFLFYAVVLGLTGNKSVYLLKLDSDCLTEGGPHGQTAILFSVMCMLDQCLLWGLTANKYRDAIRRGWSTNPIMHLVMRDSSWSCLAICCLLISTLPPALTARETPNIIYSLFCALVSILTCRTILNMRGLWNPDASLSIDIATIDIELTDVTQPE